MVVGRGLVLQLGKIGVQGSLLLGGARQHQADVGQLRRGVRLALVKLRPRQARHIASQRRQRRLIHIRGNARDNSGILGLQNRAVK